LDDGLYEHHEKEHTHKEVHVDKYDDHEVYSVTDLKKTNLGSGRQHHGGGFATKDGFYYTRTEDYNPLEKSKSIARVHPVPSKRVGHYTEEVIKPIVVRDNPFEKLSNLVSSSHSTEKDDGPAFEYPEVIQGQGRYGDNVERHISGLRDTYAGNSGVAEAKPKHNGYSTKKQTKPKDIIQIQISWSIFIWKKYVHHTILLQQNR